VVVLADAEFGANEGIFLRAANAGTFVFVNGNYTAGCCIVGKLMPTPQLDLSHPYIRDDSGLAVSRGRVQLRNCSVRHHNTRFYALQSKFNQSSRTNYSKEFNGPGVAGIEESGRSKINVNTRNTDVTVRVEAPGPGPCTIVSAEFEADWSRAGDT